LLGVSVLLLQSPWLFNLVKIFGALYLIILVSQLFVTVRLLLMSTVKVRY